MKYCLSFLIISALLAITALQYRGWLLILLWPTISFGIVALGYLCIGPSIFGKSSKGVLSPMPQFVLLPFLLCLWFVWHVIRLLNSEPAIHQLTDTVYIGRRLMPHEFPNIFEHVIDLTCEFTEPTAIRSSAYQLFPILDGMAPSSNELRSWVRQVATMNGSIFIHCAQGHGRTALFAAALLLELRHAKSPADALQFIQSKRPLARLNAHQIATLSEMHEAK